MTMDDGTDGWKGRPDTTTSGQNQGYYISRYSHNAKLKNKKVLRTNVFFGDFQ
jgi:hypothetical protein